MKCVALRRSEGAAPGFGYMKHRASVLILALGCYGMHEKNEARHYVGNQIGPIWNKARFRHRDTEVPKRSEITAVRGKLGEVGVSG